MKVVKNVWRLLSVFLILLSCSLGVYAEEQGDQQVVVTVDEPGMLPDRVGSEKNEIKSLKVIGDLNGKDIRFIREMAGVGIDGSKIETGCLVDLDLSDANIVEGSEYYLSITSSWNGTVTNFSTAKNEISNGMFQSSRLENIVLPNSVVKIGMGALSLCKSLQTVTIGSSTEGIENYAFMGCTSLEKITLLPTVPPVYVPQGAGLAMQVFDGIDCLKCKLYVPTESIDEYCESFWKRFKIYDPSVIPNDELVSIELNEAGSLMNTSEKLMYTYTKLKIKGDINGTDIAYLRKILVSPKANLGSLDLSESHIVEGGDSYNEEQYTATNTVGDYMFSFCKLENIILPNNIVAMGKFCFAGSFINTISIPEGVEDIPDYAFWNCTNLESVLMRNNVKMIGREAFSGCTHLKSVELPEGLVSIGSYAFSECALENVTIPNSICELGRTAFRSNPLLEIVVPNSITKIDDEIFDRCKSLTSVTIGNAVESIGRRAFWYCTNLKSFTCLTSTPPVLVEGESFEDVDLGQVTLYVPQGSKEKYEQADVWKDFGKIVEINPTNNIVGTEKQSSSFVVSRYSVNGQRLAMPSKGMNIVKYSDGSVRKEIVK